MKKNVTLKDIAKKANVSHATVSRALNDHREININTREKIKNIAKEMGYFPNVLARGLVNNTSKSIGVIIPDITNPFFSQIIKGVEDFSNYKGYSVILSNTSWDEEREIKNILEMAQRRIDGLIITPVSGDTYYRIKELNINTPVVYIAGRLDESDMNYVVIDDEMAGFTATEYLINLGHENIFFIGGSDKTVGIVHRLQGFKKALAKHNIECPSSSVINCSIRRDSGYAVMSDLIQQNRIPTAVVAGNDFIALGVMEAIEANGLSVPEDVSIIGFDNIDFAAFSKISLTTIDVPKYEMGKAAAEIIINNSKENNLKVPNQVVVESSLKIRSSCRKI